MNYKMLAGAACAALTVLAAPVNAASAPSFNMFSQSTGVASSQAVDAFYASRHGAPLWLSQGPSSPSARALISVLRQADLDGLQSGPALAAQADSLIARAAAGDQAALASADRLLSNAWVMYVQALQRPPAGMTVADRWAAPRQQPAQEILQRAAAAGSLAQYVRETSVVNPLYAQLREAAAQQLANGVSPDARVLASLDRARTAPIQKKYVMVDAASARLYMVENGRIADTMRVVVGKPSAPTPMMASTIYYATVNPYWHVTDELVQSLIAPNVLKQGVSYLKSHGYELFTSYADDALKLSPDKVDWKAVAAGRATVEVRQLPGPANSMGQLKIGFPNAQDIYLHDTPNKGVFAASDRDLSHGCIRLEDAPRLERWLLGAEAPATDQPEHHVLLPTPVPIYITYLTAHGEDGQLTFVDDVYGRDSVGGAVTVAAN